MNLIAAIKQQESLRSFARVVPCLFLAGMVLLGGGRAESPWLRGGLQISACLVLIGCLVASGKTGLRMPARLMLMIFVAFVAIVAAQLVPLPPEVWTTLPGRAPVREGFEALGGGLPFLPVSLAPTETIASLLMFLPPLAAFALMVSPIGRRAASFLPWVIVLLAFASIGLGVVQVLGGVDSPFYLYSNTNRGQAVGFMANANHQGTLLVMAIPFVALLLVGRRISSEMGDSDIGQTFMVGVIGAAICFGVLLAGSAAAYALLGPTVVAALFIFRGSDGRRRTGMLLVFVGLVVAVLALALINSPVLTGLGVTDIWATGSMSRIDMYARTSQAMLDHMPVGSGLGSFQSVYPLYEDPAIVTNVVANNAHNDYLEFVLDMGLPGVALIVAVIGWWAWRTIQIWRDRSDEDWRLRRAASIAVGVVILHSAMDYPLRTVAVATLTAICLGIMAGPASSRQRSRDAAAKPATNVPVEL